MRALVTGVGGFIGSTLAETLLRQGHEVRGVDVFTDYYDPALKRRNLAEVDNDALDLVEGDLNELDLASLVDGIDAIFHLAGQPGVRSSWGDTFQIYLDQNVLATQRLLEATRGSDLKRFVYASSSSIYGDAESFPTSEDDTPSPISPYGVTKLAGEHLCRLYHRAYGSPTVALRYFTIYGPRQRPDMAFNRFIRAALEGTEITVYGDGLQVRDFTYVDDCVAATMAAAESGEPGQVYNIAGGGQTNVREVIELIEKLTGRSVAVNNIEKMAGDARRTGADTSRAAKDLGFAPSVDLREGLSRQVAHAGGGA